MADPRTEIREAFEREQSAFPPLPGIRHEIVDALATRQKANPFDGSQPDFQWLAVGAAVLITAAILAGLVSVRLTQRQVPGRPAPITHVAAPEPIPGTDYGPPQAGVPLLYVWDLTRPGSLLGFDWSGRPRATLQLGVGVTWRDAGIQMAPDGQLFEFRGFGVVHPIYLDRFGQPISRSPEAMLFGTWADDNRHICEFTFDYKTLVGQLLIQGPTEATHAVMSLSSTLGPGWTSISLAACSIRNDRAIAVRTSNDGVSDVWVIRLSSGQVVTHRAYAASSVASVIASRDASFLGETSTLSWQPPTKQGAESTIVRRVSDWQVLLALPGQVEVRGFSADDSRVLAVEEPPDPMGPILSQIIDRSSKHVVWQNQAAEEAFMFETRSGSGDFALGMRGPAMPACGLPPCLPDVDLLIVHPDGSTIQIPGRYYTVW